MIIDDSWDKKNGSTILIEGELIEEVKSDYQHIEIFETKRFGKLLRLDGVIQLTNINDNFSGESPPTINDLNLIESLSVSINFSIDIIYFLN